MWNKKIFRKILSFILALVFFLNIPITANASPSKKIIYVDAASTAMTDSCWLALLAIDDTAYISAADAARLSGQKLDWEKNGSAHFSSGYHQVEFTGKNLTLDGIVYYELQTIMDALSTKYEYDHESDTLLFISCDSFYENLLWDCRDVFVENYSIAYLDNELGYKVATIADVVLGMRFLDFSVGKYTTELYEDVLHNIMQVDENTAPLLSLSIEADGIMSKLSTAYSINQMDFENYGTLLGYPYDEYIEVYRQINDLSKGVYSIGDFLSILQSVSMAYNSVDLYANAIKYSIVKNPNSDNKFLDYAAESICTYYDQTKTVQRNIFWDSFSDMLLNLANDSLEGLFLGSNAAILKGLKFVLDEWGLKEIVKKEQHAHVCSIIQATAKQFFYDNFYKSNEDFIDFRNTALNLKYSTLLYLRACQYTYSLYETDTKHQTTVAYKQKQVQKAIERIAINSDIDLQCDVTNKKLMLPAEGDFLIVDLENGEKVQIQEGTYQNDQVFDELTVTLVDDNNIIFNVFWYRAAGMDDVVATRYGNYAFFDYETEDGYHKTSGYLKIINTDIIELIITETELQCIEPGCWSYSYVSKQELLEQQKSLYVSWLLLNNDSKGWIKREMINNLHLREVYFRFNSSGMMQYWHGTSFGGDLTYNVGTCSYSLEVADGTLLYIDNCAYVVEEIYSTGRTHMSIRALGEYSEDFSGSYELIEDDIYKFFNYS